MGFVMVWKENAFDAKERLARVLASQSWSSASDFGILTCSIGNLLR